MIDLKKIQWKIPVTDTTKIDAWDFFCAFSGWIPDSPEIFIDVADYRHIHDGPKIALIGHFVDFFLDASDNNLSLIYSHKRGLDGTDTERLTHTLQQTRAACARLEQDEIFKSRLKFSTQQISLIINDRACAPNDQKTLMRFRPLAENVVAAVTGQKIVRVTPHTDSRARFGMTIEI